MQPWPGILGITRGILLATLAAWIGLWPAADAVTCASRTVFVFAENASVPPCSRHLASDQAPTCGGSSCNSDDDAPACSGAATSGCGQLFCVGGLIFFTPAEPPPDFQPEPQNSVPCGSCRASTRCLQPPVPPPIGDLAVIV